MKKTLLITLLFFYCFSITAQEKNGSQNKKNKDVKTVNNRTSGITNTYVVKYNFKTKVFDRNLIAPTINHPVVFQIDSINRLAYDVIITSKDSSLTKGIDIDEPSKKNDTIKKIKNVEVVNVLNNDISNINYDEMLYKGIDSKDKNYANSNTLIANEKKHKNELRELEEKINKFKLLKSKKQTQLTEMQSDTIKNKSEIELIEKDKITIDSTITTINTKIRQTAKLQEQVSKDIDANNLKNKKIEKLLDIRDSIYTSYRKILFSAKEINEIFQKNNMLLAVARNPQVNCAEEFNAMLKDSINGFHLINGISSYRKKIDAICSEFIHLKKLINNMKIDQSDLNVDKDLKTVYSDLSKSVDEVFNSVKEIEKDLNTKNPQQVITNMISIINHLRNPSTYTIVSAPIQPTQDLVIFKVDIKLKKDYEYKDERKFTYKEYTKGGIRYDFSTGLVLGFNVNDYSFTKELLDNNMAVITEKENTNQYAPAIAAMLHVSFRTHRLVSFGLTLGASLNTTELDINSLFPGISILVGKTEKFIFTAGPALKKIKYLKSDFEIGKEYTASTLPDTFETEPTFRLGWFVGLSYNLTNKQRTNYSIVNK